MATLMVSVVLAGVVQAFISMSTAHAATTRRGLAQSEATTIVDTVAAALRRGAGCAQRKGCPEEDGAVIRAAGPSDLTVYTTGGGETQRFYIENGTFHHVLAGRNPEAVPEAELRLTYYRAAEYHADDLVPFSPAPGEFHQIIAVDVSAAVTRGGIVGAFETTIRLRNGPYPSRSGN